MYNNTFFWVSKYILGCLLFSFYLLYLGYSYPLDMDASQNSVSRPGLSGELWVPLSKTSEFEFHTLFAKNLPPSDPLAHQSVVWRGFPVWSQRHTIPTPLSFTFLSRQKGFPPLSSTGCFSLLQFTSMHLAPVTLPPSNRGRDPSFSTQTDVLGVPSDLTSIQLCSRDEESLGSPYFPALTPM